jgi:predicted nucleic acid-binding protein
MMTLVDTSVWVDHLRRRNDRLAGLLDDARVLCHPFIIGELACGNLAERGRILRLLGALPGVPLAEHEEVLKLAGAHKLHGHGLGWIDMHLLASTLLAGCGLWTLDRRLEATAVRMGAFVPAE